MVRLIRGGTCIYYSYRLGNETIKEVLPNWIKTTPFLRGGRGCQHMKVWPQYFLILRTSPLNHGYAVHACKPFVSSTPTITPTEIRSAAILQDRPTSHRCLYSQSHRVRLARHRECRSTEAADFTYLTRVSERMGARRTASPTARGPRLQSQRLSGRVHAGVESTERYAGVAELDQERRMSDFCRDQTLI